MTSGETLGPPAQGLFDLGPLIDRERHVHNATRILSSMDPEGYKPYKVARRLKEASLEIAKGAIDAEDARVLTEFDYLEEGHDPSRFASSRAGKSVLQTLERRFCDAAQALRASDHADYEQLNYLWRFVGRPSNLPAEPEAVAGFLLEQYDARERYLEALAAPYLMGASIASSTMDPGLED